jgi:uncharacterized RDD family membrane protein YckC
MLDGFLIVLVVESLPLDASDFLSSDVTLVTRRVLPAILLIPLEALLVSTFAVTPGKWLFGISGVRKDGSRLGVGESLRRSISVFFLGLGAGLLTPLAAWSIWRIASKGETAWDHNVGSVVIWRRSHLRAACALLVLIALFYFRFQDWLSSLAPMRPGSFT